MIFGETLILSLVTAIVLRTKEAENEKGVSGRDGGSVADGQLADRQPEGIGGAGDGKDVPGLETGGEVPAETSSSQTPKRGSGIPGSGDGGGSGDPAQATGHSDAPTPTPDAQGSTRDGTDNGQNTPRELSPGIAQFQARLATLMMPDSKSITTTRRLQIKQRKWQLSNEYQEELDYAARTRDDTDTKRLLEAYKFEYEAQKKRVQSAGRKAVGAKPGVRKKIQPPIADTTGDLFAKLPTFPPE